MEIGIFILKQITIGNWLLEIDMEKTRDFYEKGIEVCNCLYCNNFVEWRPFNTCLF